MSKYFTKYIPVEGEIKEGDRVLLPSGQIVKAVQETLGLCWWRKDGSAYQKINKNDKKLKLFLCSRDIKVGDEVTCINSKLINFGKKAERLKQNLLKQTSFIEVHITKKL